MLQGLTEIIKFTRCMLSTKLQRNCKSAVEKESKRKERLRNRLQKRSNVTRNSHVSEQGTENDQQEIENDQQRLRTISKRLRTYQQEIENDQQEIENDQQKIENDQQKIENDQQEASSDASDSKVLKEMQLKFRKHIANRMRLRKIYEKLCRKFKGSIYLTSIYNFSQNGHEDEQSSHQQSQLKFGMLSVLGQLNASILAPR